MHVVGLEAVRKLSSQRGKEVVRRPSIAVLDDRGPRFIEHQHPFGKHDLMLLSERIPAIACMTRENRPEDLVICFHESTQ